MSHRHSQSESQEFGTDWMGSVTSWERAMGNLIAPAGVWWLWKELTVWDLSELYWFPFRSCAYYQKLVTRHWSGSVSVPVERQHPVPSSPGCVYMARMKRGALQF